MTQGKFTAFKWIYFLAQSIKRKLLIRRVENFRAQYRRSPASLDLCIELQRDVVKVFGKPNFLVPPETQCLRNGAMIRDVKVSKIFRHENSWPWRLPDDTINWLVDYLYRVKPRSVLEFGSGLSTACLCMVLEQIHGSNGFRLLTVEQSIEEMERTNHLLSRYTASHSCRVVYAPLASAFVGERSTFFYDLKEIPMEHWAWLGKAEFILIDGPYADGPCRYGTLAQVRQHLMPGARFAMDDGLREKELLAGILWGKEGICVDGILTVGEGLMIGSVPNP